MEHAILSTANYRAHMENDLRSISLYLPPDFENSTERFITYAVYLQETGGNSEALKLRTSWLYHVCEIIANIIAAKCDGTVRFNGYSLSRRDDRRN